MLLLVLFTNFKVYCVMYKSVVDNTKVLVLTYIKLVDWPMPPKNNSEDLAMKIFIF